MNTEIQKKRNALYEKTREFFDSLGYLEVETPILSRYAIPERTIEKFKTMFSHPFLGESELYLLPSPEYYMKRLLAEGSGSIYQICKCFRNSEQIGRIHNIEFTMLEYYTVGADSNDSIDITGKYLKHVGIEREMTVITMSELIRNTAGFEIDEAQSIDSLRREAERLSITVSPDDGWDDIFNKIFLTYSEPAIGKNGIVFITDYPKQIECLAETKGNYKDRWEVYIDGVETGNCYTEAVNHSLYIKDGSDFSRLTIPQSSGVAIGMDRLLMAIAGIKKMSEALLFEI